MTHNDAKTAQTLDEVFDGSHFSGTSCEQSVWRTTAHNGAIQRRLPAQTSDDGRDGYGRWASYRLAERVAGARRNAEGTPDTTVGDSEHQEPSSSHKIGNSSHNEGDSLQSDQFDPALLIIAEQARAKGRLTPETMQEVLTALCAVRELSLDEIGRLLQRNARGIRNRYLSPMVQSGRMQLRFPDEPNHPKQAYRTNPDWKAS